MTTESDRELLELAAKAYWGDEIDDVCSIRWLEQDQAIGYTHADNQDHNGQDREFVWNPLTDDGDALRLAVKLQLQITPGTYNKDEFTAFHAGRGEAHEYRHFQQDQFAATRRAIVRAAAEIARATHKEQA